MEMLSNATAGWELAVNSIKVLNKNKQLLVFPLFSGIFLAILVAGLGNIVFSNSALSSGSDNSNSVVVYPILFLFYLACYFVIVFFNMALVYCTNMYFKNEKISITRGLQFSMKRIHVILLWAVFSATVGLALRVLKNNMGGLVKMLTGVVAFGWDIATFLVVPVLAYENIGPIDALKRSAMLMSKKWGEGVTASFSFIFMYVLAIILLVIVATAISSYVSDNAGIVLLVIGVLLMAVIGSTLQNIFVSALYSNINGNTNTHFKQEIIDEAFD